MENNTLSFNDRCYQILKLVPEGKVTTYRDIANALHTKAWRAVGSAMAKNKNLIVIPCHRVVRSNGEIGEYAQGADRKSALLKKEGVTVRQGKINNLDKYLHKFPTDINI